MSTLAIFGGKPMFDSIRPTGQLAVGETDDFFKRARQIFDRRWMTNDGPFVKELEERLKVFHGVEHCVAFANASIAIILAAHNASDGEAGEIIMPSFSYRGLPHLVRWAGHDPIFCDVDPELHTLDPRSVEKTITERTRAILAVHNVNAACDVDGLQKIADDNGIPLLLDSVYAMGNTCNAARTGASGQLEIFSLHATKLVNGFEGGYVTLNDAALADKLRMQRNFGINETGDIPVLALNGKLNEIHAAMALTCLDQLDDIMAENRQRFTAYEKTFSNIPGLSFARYTDDVRNYGLVLLHVDQDWPLTRDQTIALLRAEKALVRPYCDPPLHMDPNWASYGRADNIKNSESLRHDFIQMPVGKLTSLDDIRQMAKLMRWISANGEDISQRLEQGSADQ